MYQTKKDFKNGEIRERINSDPILKSLNLDFGVDFNRLLAFHGDLEIGDLFSLILLQKNALQVRRTSSEVVSRMVRRLPFDVSHFLFYDDILDFDIHTTSQQKTLINLTSTLDPKNKK